MKEEWGLNDTDLDTPADWGNEDATWDDNSQDWTRRPNPDAPEDSFLSALGTQISNIPSSIKQAAGGTLQSIGETPQRVLGGFQETVPEEDDNILDIYKKGYRDLFNKADLLTSAAPYAISKLFSDNPAETGKRMYEEASKSISENQPNVEPNSLKGIASSALGSVVQNAPGVAASVLTRNPAPALAQAGLTSFGQSYGEQRAGGSEPGTAMLAGLGSGEAEVLFGRLPIGTILESGTGFAKRIGKTMLEESLGEGATQITQDGIKKGTIDPNMSLGEFIQNATNAGIGGGIAGGTTSAIAHPFVKSPTAQSDITIPDPEPDNIERITPTTKLSAPQTEQSEQSELPTQKITPIQEAIPVIEPTSPPVEPVVQPKIDKGLTGLQEIQEVNDIQKNLINLYLDQESIQEALNNTNLQESDLSVMADLEFQYGTKARDQYKNLSEQGQDKDSYLSKIKYVPSIKLIQDAYPEIQEKLQTEQPPKSSEANAQNAFDATLQNRRNELSNDLSSDENIEAIIDQAKKGLTVLAKKRNSEVDLNDVLPDLRLLQLNNKFTNPAQSIPKLAQYLEEENLLKKYQPQTIEPNRPIKEVTAPIKESTESQDVSNFVEEKIIQENPTVESQPTETFNPMAAQPPLRQLAKRIKAKGNNIEIDNKEFNRVRNIAQNIQQLNPESNVTIADDNITIPNDNNILSVQKTPTGKYQAQIKNTSTQMELNLPEQKPIITDQVTNQNIVPKAINDLGIQRDLKQAAKTQNPDQFLETARPFIEDHLMENMDADQLEKEMGTIESYSEYVSKVANGLYAKINNNTPKGKTVKTNEEQLNLFPESEPKDPRNNEPAPIDKKETKFSANQTEKSPKQKAVNSIKKEIIDIAQRINPGVDLRLVDKLVGEGEQLLSSGSKTMEKQEVGGSYNPKNNLVEVSLDVKKFNPKETAYHELWHSLEGLLTKDEQAVLKNKFPDKDGLTHDEAAAYAFSQWSANKDNKDITSTVKNIFSKVSRLLNNIGNTLRKNNIRTVDDIFDDAYAGNIAERLEENKGKTINYTDDTEFPLNDIYDSNPQNIDITNFSESVAKYSAQQINKENENTVIDTATKWLNNTIDIIKNKPNFEQGIDLQFLAKSVVHPRTIAKKFKTFTPVWDQAVKQFEDRDNMATTIGATLESYYNLPDTAKNRVNAALELGRLDGENYKSSIDGTILVTNTKWDNALLSKPKESIKLNTQEVEAYNAVRQSMDMAIDFYKEMLIEESGYNINTTNPKDIKESIYADKDNDTAQAITKLNDLLDKSNAENITPEMKGALSRNINKLVDKIAEKTSSKQAAEIRDKLILIQQLENMDEAKRKGYIPFSRFGNYALVVQSSDGEIQWREHFEVSDKIGKKQLDEYLKGAEINKKISELKNKFPKSVIKGPVLLSNQAALKQAGVDLTSLDTLAKTSGTDMEFYKGFREDIERELQKKGFRRHFIKSQNIPGYTTDFERAIGDYVIGVTSYIARRKALPKLQKALGDIDPIKQGQLRQYGDKYVKYIQNAQEELQRWKNIVYNFYLSGRMSSAVVNLTQVPLVTMPYLTTVTSFSNANVELARAYKDVAGMLSFKKGMPFFDLSKAPSDIKDDLINADKDGYLVPQLVFEQLGVATSSRAKLLRGKKWWKKVAEGLSNAYSSTERINRLVSYIAANRIGQSQEVRDKANKVLSENNLWKSETNNTQNFADSFARWIIDETHFKLGKVNRPTITRGYGGAIFQFKAFALNLLEIHHQMLTGMGPEGKKAFAVSMAMLFSSAGLFGLPFAEDIKDIFETLYKLIADEEIDLDKELRLTTTELTGNNKLGELISQGPARLAGVDIASRTGMGNIIPGLQTIKAGIAGEKMNVQRIFSDLLGIGADMWIGRPYRFAESIKDGRPFYESFAEVLPNWGKDPISAYSWASKGIQLGDKSRIEASPKDIALRSIGFTSSNVALMKELKYMQMRANRAVDDKQTRYYKQITQAALDGDQKRISSLIKEVQEYNKGKEHYRQIILNKAALKRMVKFQRAGVDAINASDKATPEIMRIRQLMPEEYKELSKGIKTGDYNQLKKVIPNASKDNIDNAVKDSRIPELNQLMNSKGSQRALDAYKKIIEEDSAN
jgi:hypothetical protein